MKRGIGIVVAGWLIAGVGCGTVDDSTNNAGAGRGGSSGRSNAAGSAGLDTTGNEGGRAHQGGGPNQGGRDSASSGHGGADDATGGNPFDSAGSGATAGGLGLGGAQGEAGTGASAGNADDSGGSSGMVGSAGDAGGTPITCSCGSGKQCLRVTVTRAADTTRQPWVVWPTQADGTGTLVVSAATRSLVVQDRVRIPNANFRPADASYGVALCVPPGTSEVRAFLDHGNDEDPRQVTSSDYLDSCAPGSAACFRCFDVSVTAGTDVDLGIALATTCD